MKYKQNLRIEGNKVFSYSTHVATIRGGQLIVHGWWSKTTSKHINRVADVYGLTKVEGERESEREPERNPFSALAMVMKIGEIEHSGQKERNDWKVRMLKAGIPEGALHMPEDWHTLSEDEKEARLNKVIEVFKS